MLKKVFQSILDRRPRRAPARRAPARPTPAAGARRPAFECLEARLVMTNTDYVIALYQDVLGRVASEAEIAGHVANLAAGATPTDVARSFWESTEHRARQLDEFYQRFLGRPIDGVGLAGWLGKFQQGASETEIILGILNSAEYRAGRPDPNQFIDSLYVSLLGRSSSPAERQDWLAQFGPGVDGFAVATFGIVHSLEHANRQVESLYDQLLGRPSDPAGLSGFVSALVGGTLDFAQIASAVGASTEYQANADARASGGAPRVFVGSPASGVFTIQNIDVIGSVALGDQPLARIEARVDGGSPTNVAFDAATLQFTFQTAFALDGSQEGARQVEIRAIDTLGRGNSTTIVVNLDTIAPAAPVFGLAPTSDTGVAGDAITDVARVTLTGAAEAGVRLFLVQPETTALASNSGSFFMPDVSLASGANVLALQAIDRAGNSSETQLTVTRIAPTGQADPVIAWNLIALEAIRLDSDTPPEATRGLAIVHSAILDAVNAIDGTPGRYVSLPAPAGASPYAAVAAAAHAALSYLYPAQSAVFDAALATWLAQVSDPAARDAGRQLGEDIAQAIIELRESDGYDAYVNHISSLEPGVWQPTAPVFAEPLLPHWGSVTPFVIGGAEAFFPEGPPDLSSQDWADAFNEVKAYSAQFHAVPAGQPVKEETNVARFWADGGGTYTPPGHWNQIAEVVSAAQGNSLSDNARLFAQLNVALADAAILCWDVKFTENFWRPITAIQNADLDDNVQTSPDPTWAPLITTPPFPEYVSGHSTFSGAAAAILTDFFGDDVGFTVGSFTPNNLVRTFNSFEEAAAEAALSRLYGGIHYRFSNEDGLTIGRNLGEFVLAAFSASEDTQAPTILVAETPAVTSQNITVAGQILDNLAGLQAATVAVDGGAEIPLALGSRGSFSFTTALGTSGLADGEHTLRFRAVDAAGNVGERIVSFVLDTSAPDFDLLTPLDQEHLSNSSFLTGAVSGTGSAITQLSYAFDGGPSTPLPFFAGAGTTVEFDQLLDYSDLAIGAHTLTVTARDSAGLVSSISVPVNVSQRSMFFLSKVTPVPGSTEVGSTFRPQIFFTRAVDPATLTSSNFYATDSAGQKLPAQTVPGQDGTFAWLFFASPMPGASTITVHIDGSTIRAAADNLPLDADVDGAPGGAMTYRFTTVSLTPIPGTTLFGKVVDPGPDLVPATFDDERPGPDLRLMTADDVYLLPIANVRVFIVGMEGVAGADTFTDAAGNFTLTAVPAGNVKVAFDGRTATNPPAGFFFPEMVMDLTMKAGVANTVMSTMMVDPARAEAISMTGIHLPRLKNAILHDVSPTETTRVTVAPESAAKLTPEQAQSLVLEIEPGTLVDEHGQPLANPQIGISTVPAELVRDMLPPGVMQHTFDITIQAPGAAAFTRPARLTFPNLFGAAPGTQLNFLSFDHTTGRLVIEGTATVSADGKTVVTDPGSGITKPGWHGLTPPGSEMDQCFPPDLPPADEGSATASVVEVLFDDGTRVEGGASALVAPRDNSEPHGGLSDKLFFSRDAKYKLEFSVEIRDGKIFINGEDCGIEEEDGPSPQVRFEVSYQTAPGVPAIPVFRRILTKSNPSMEYEVRLNELFPKPELTIERNRLTGGIITVKALRIRSSGPAVQIYEKSANLYRFYNIEERIPDPTKLGDQKHDPTRLNFEKTLATSNFTFFQQKVIDLVLPPQLASSFQVHVEGGSTSEFHVARSPGTMTVSFSPKEEGEFGGELFFSHASPPGGAGQAPGLGPIFLTGRGVGLQPFHFSKQEFKDVLRSEFLSGKHVHGTQSFVDFFSNPDPKVVEKSLDDLFNDVLERILLLFSPIDPSFAWFDPTVALESSGAGDVIHYRNNVDYQHEFLPRASRTTAPPIAEVTLPGPPPRVGMPDSFAQLNFAIEVGDVSPTTNVTVQLQVFNRQTGAWEIVRRPDDKLAEFTITDKSANVSRSVYLRSAILPSRQFRVVVTAANAAPTEYRVTLLHVIGSDVEDFKITGESSSLDFANQQFITDAAKRDTLSLAQRKVLFDALVNRSKNDPSRNGSGIYINMAPALAVSNHVPLILYRDALVASLANTIAHEMGHVLGVIHNQSAKEQYLEGDIMGPTSSGINPPTFGPVSQQILKLALGIPFTDSFATTYNYYYDFARTPSDGFNNAYSSSDPDDIGPLLSIFDAPVAADAPLPSAVSAIGFGQTVADGPLGQSATRTIFLVNSGTQELGLDDIAVLGGGGAFTVTSVHSFPSTIPSLDPENLDFASSTVAVSVAFDPVAVGDADAVLRIKSDSVVRPTFEIPLSGLGMSQSGDLRVAVDNNNLGGLRIDADPVTSSGFATLTNQGLSELTITRIAVVDESQFAVAGLPAGFGPGQPIVLAPGASLTFDVEFDAKNLGLQRGVIEIESDDPETPVFRQHIVGTGLVNSGLGVEWGNDFVVTRAGDGLPLRTRSSPSGRFSFFLPPTTRFESSIFDPVSGLISHTEGVSSAAGSPTHLGMPIFLASTAADSDGDGLPDDIEFAVGSSPRRADTDGDGIDDFAEIAGRLDSRDSDFPPTGIVATVELRGEANEVVLEGSPINGAQQTAYVATGSFGLAIVDTTRLRSPAILSQLDLAGEAVDVAVDTAAGLAAVAANAGGLHLIDISAPTAPVLLETIAIDAAQVEIADGIAYVAQGVSVRAYDLLTGNLRASLDLGSQVRSLAVEHNFLYAMTDDSFHVIEFDAEAMTQRSSVQVNLGGSDKLFVGGGIAYVAVTQQFVGGFAAFDVSNPDLPVLLTAGAPGIAIAGTALAADGSGLAVAVGASNAGASFVAADILDVSDPSNPGALVNRISLPAPPLGVTIAAGLAYVAGGSAGLHVLNYRPFDTEGTPPTVGISSPTVADLDPDRPGVQVLEGDSLPIQIAASDDVQIRNVELLVNGQVVRNDISFPFQMSALAVNADPLATTASVQTRATDTGGNVALSNVLVFDFGPDTIAPFIRSIQQETGYGGRVTVRIRANEPLQVDTITPATVQLRDGSGAAIAPRSMVLQRGDREIVLTYPAGSAGQLFLDAAAISDRAGNLLVGFDPPEIVAAVPSAGSVSGAGTDRVRIDFSEPIDAGLIASNFTVTRTDTGDVIPFSVVVLNGAQAAELRFASALADGAYRVEVQAIELVDADLLPLGVGKLLATAFDVESTPPSIVSLDPADGTAKPESFRVVTIEFSEPMDPADLTAQNLRLVGPNSQTVSPAAIELQAGGRVVKLSYDPLAGGAHQFTIAAAQVSDRFGNPLGVADIVTGFTIAQEAPSIVSVDPADGAVKPATFRIVTIEFSEPMDPAGFTAQNLRLVGPNSQAVPPLAIDLSGDGLVATATYDVLAGGAHQFTIAAAALSDLSGNPLGVADIVIGFTIFQQSIGSFFGGDLVATGDDPSAFVLGDFNNDGRRDIVVANDDDETISVFRIAADGSLGAALTSDLGGFDPEMLAAGHLNGDGNLDLIVAGSDPDLDFDGAIAVLSGDGVGQLTTTQVIGLRAEAIDVALADVTGDGLDDLVVLSEAYGSSVSVYAGLGTLAGNAFAAPVVFSLGREVRAMALADLDDDGDIDIGVAADGSSGSELLVMLNEGTGVFPGKRSTVDGELVALSRGDFDGDGILDLAAVYDTDDGVGVSIALGTGNGEFAQPVTAELNLFNPIGLAVGDFFVGGNDELVVAGTNFDGDTQIFTLILGPGAALSVENQKTVVGHEAESMAVGDVDGNGTPDVLLGTDVFEQELVVTLGAGDGSFGAEIVVAAEIDAINIAVGELDGDTNLDVVVADRNGAARVLLGDGAGGFQLGDIFGAGNGRDFESLTMADFDGDTLLDLISSVDIGAVVFPGIGDGTFGTPVDQNVGVGFVATRLGDLDGDTIANIVAATNDERLAFINGAGGLQAIVGLDGEPLFLLDEFTGDSHLDLVVGTQDGDVLFVLAGDGAGNFTDIAGSANVFAVSGDAIDIVVTHLDNDGTLDVAVLSETTYGPMLGGFPTVSALFGVGGGDFGAEIVSNVTQFGAFVDRLEAGDFTGDGHTDLVIASNTSGGVRIYAGTGNGFFFTSSGVLNGEGVQDIALHDFDADGSLDLAILDNLNATVQVVRNDGAGNPAAAYYGIGNQTVDLAMGDMNGDDRDDIVVVDRNNGVTILLASAGGGFTPGAFPYGLSQQSGVVLADLNDDDRLDIIISSDAGSAAIGVLLADDFGGFALNTYTLAGPVDQLAAGDVTGDGLPDIVAGGGSLYFVLAANPDGSLQPAAPYTAPGPIKDLALLDVDGDTDLDVVATIGAAFEAGKVVLATNLGGGVFPNRANPAPGAPQRIAVADMNGDMVPDLVAISSSFQGFTSEGFVSVFLGEPDGTYRNPVSLSFGDKLPDSIAIADIDGDTQLDVVMTTFQSSGFFGPPVAEFQFLRGNGDGTLSAPVASFIGNSQATNVTLADLDGDDDLDAVVAVLAENSVSRFLGDGSGGFANGLSILQTFATDLAVADIDGDTLLDVIANESSTATLRYVLGNGDATFGSPVDVVAGDGNVQVFELGDVTGDGELDLIVPGASSDNNFANIAVLAGDGSGNFAAPVGSPLSSANVTALTLGHVDGDGVLDAVAIAADIGSVLILRSAGGGGMSESLLAVAGLLPQSLVLAGLNGDGNADLAVASNANLVLVMPGDGAGNFIAAADPLASLPLTDPDSLLIGDVDGDALPDLVVIDSGAVAVFLNAGGGAFQPPVFTPSTFGVGSLALGDVDGDGRADLLLADSNTGRVTLLLGGSGGTFDVHSDYPAGGDGVILNDIDDDGDLDLIGLDEAASSLNVLRNKRL